MLLSDPFPSRSAPAMLARHSDGDGERKITGSLGYYVRFSESGPHRRPHESGVLQTVEAPALPAPSRRAREAPM